MNSIVVLTVDEIKVIGLDGKLINKLSLPTDNNITFCIHPDGKFIFVGQADGIVVALDMKGKWKDSKLSSDLSSLAISDDGKLLAVGAADGSIDIWILPTSKSKSRTHVGALFGHYGKVTSLKFTNFDELISGGSDTLVYEWNPYKLTIMQAMEGHESEITDIVTTPGDGVITCGGVRDGTAQIWQAETGASICSTPQDKVGLTCLDVDLKSMLLFTGNRSGDLAIYNLKDMKLVDKWQAHSTDLRGIRVLPDRNKLITACYDCIFLWDLANRKPELCLLFESRGIVKFDLNKG